MTNPLLVIHSSVQTWKRIYFTIKNKVEWFYYDYTHVQCTLCAYTVRWEHLTVQCNIYAAWWFSFKFRFVVKKDLWGCIKHHFIIYMQWTSRRKKLHREVIYEIIHLTCLKLKEWISVHAFLLMIGVLLQLCLIHMMKCITEKQNRALKHFTFKNQVSHQRQIISIWKIKASIKLVTFRAGADQREHLSDLQVFLVSTQVHIISFAVQI